MILHIAQDDKFLKTIIQIFEAAASGQNKYVVWKQPNTFIPSYFYRFKFNHDLKIKSIPARKNTLRTVSKNVDHQSEVIAVDDFGSDSFFDQIGQISEYKLIIFHSLVYNHAKLFLLFNKKINSPIIWMPFGYEIYNMLPEFRKDLYQNQTARIINRISTRTEYLFNILTLFKAISIRKAIKQLKYCAISIDTEFLLYKKRLNPKLKQFWFTYYPLDILIDQNIDDIEAPNILVGNSAFPSNNHIEAFNLLRNFRLENKKIIVPLSYGSMNYGAKIGRKGRKYFGDKFYALTEFLPIEEYNNIVKSCGIVIMNQNRQQAFGNILSSLWFGAKVYLNPENTIYEYLKTLGIIVFSIEELNKSGDVLNNLSPENAKKNREILMNEYSFINIVERTREMIRLK